MLEQLIEVISNSKSICREWHNNEMYYCVVDIVSVLLKIDIKPAQNYYHVWKKRMKNNGQELPLIKKLKTKRADGKSYLTDFTNIAGIQIIYEYIKTNLARKKIRIEHRNDDEIAILHPKVITLLQAKNWVLQHHVRLPSGSIIDIVASYEGQKYIIECKVYLTKTDLQHAIGQVLTYVCEYDEEVIPVIASYDTEFNEYSRMCCQRLGIMILAIQSDSISELQGDLIS